MPLETLDVQYWRERIKEGHSKPLFKDVTVDEKLALLELIAEELQMEADITLLRDTYRTGTEKTPLNYVQAATVAKRLVEHDIKTHGRNNYKTIEDQAVLAQLLLATGEFYSARGLFRRLRSLWESSGERNERRILWAVQGEADALAATKHRRKALRLTQYAVEQRTRHLGAEDPDSLFSSYRLAVLLKELGKKEKALELAEKVWGDQRRTLGPYHPDALASRRLILELRQHNWPPEQAEEHFQHHFDQAKVHLGERHPETLSALFDLAKVQASMGYLMDAVFAFEEVVDEREEVIGEHPETIRALLNSIWLWHRLGNRRLRNMDLDILFWELYVMALGWLIQRLEPLEDGRSKWVQRTCSPILRVITWLSSLIVADK